MLTICRQEALEGLHEAGIKPSAFRPEIIQHAFPICEIAQFEQQSDETFARPSKQHLEQGGLPNGDRLPLLAELDSGADVTTVPADFLASTPIDVTRLPVLGDKASTAGGEVELRHCPLEIWYGKWKACDGFYVLPAGAMPDPMVLLGCDDFFRRFVITFDWSRNPPVFDIKRAKT